MTVELQSAGLEIASHERAASGRKRGRSLIPQGMVAALLSFFLTAVPLQADNRCLDARHANMKRFYDEAHPPPPPTLLEIKAAAERGEASGQYQLAELYNSTADYQDALVWYRKAAEQGHTNAQYHAGEMLLNGRNANANSPVPIVADPNEAVIWLGRAANRGHVEGQMDLAGCYRDGVGVNQDLIEALKWFTLAARQTNAIAQKAVQELSLKLTADQIAAAQSRVSSFVPGKNLELPQPAFLGKLKLNGISGPRTNRLAIVNNRTLSVNETTQIRLEGKLVDVRCIEIRDRSVLLQVGPYRKELLFQN